MKTITFQIEDEFYEEFKIQSIRGKTTMSARLRNFVLSKLGKSSEKIDKRKNDDLFNPEDDF